LATELEEILEALERMDIPVTDQTTIDDFQAALAEELGYDPSQLQMTAFYGKGVAAQEQLAELGIRQVKITYPWATEIRYGWKEAPGLWGWQTIAEWYGFEYTP